MNYDFNLNNSLLQFDDIMMFREGHVLTEKEKKKLTSKNLDIMGDFKTTIVDFGARNWNFSLEAVGVFKLGVLDKTYSKFVFYGNEADHPYQTEAGKGSQVFSYWKTSFKYALPFTVNLGMIPKLFPAETENTFLAAVRDLPLAVGANLNINYSMQYGGLIESSQKFGSMPDSLYYDINVRYAFTDEKSCGRMNPSLGFGLQADIWQGAFHFNIDDLFLQLTYRNLSGGEIVKVVTDSLLYLQEDYKPHEYENSENDSLRLKKHTLKFKPSVSVGYERSFFNRLDMMIKYSSNQLTQTDGLAFGATMMVGVIPLQTIVGFSDNTYFKFQTGLKLRKFQWVSGMTFYHGFFRYAKGIGFNSSIDLKF